MLEDLDITFIEGGMVDLKSADVPMLQAQLKKVRQMRVKKLMELAKKINEIRS